jgi:GNAT superfamily N-acetyltransferase
MEYCLRNEIAAVRLASPEDLPLCIAFERLDEFGRVTDLDGLVVEANIRTGGVFLAECQREVIGYASLNFLYASRTPLLSWWYVDPAYRGKGIGSLLFSAVQLHLADLGFARLLVSACRAQEIARHRAHGLRETGYLDLGGKEQEVFFEQLLDRSSTGASTSG